MERHCPEKYHYCERTGRDHGLGIRRSSSDSQRAPLANRVSGTNIPNKYVHMVSFKIERTFPFINMCANAQHLPLNGNRRAVT